MRCKGKIASWNDDKGFGFVVPFDGGAKVFIHIKAIKNRGRRPEVNDVVTYSTTKDNQGRTQAANATMAGERIPKKSAHGPNRIAIIFACMFLVAVGVSFFFADLPLIIVGAYILLSMFTFIAYAIDKAAAQAGRWRTSEATLHLLALLGGWPGALLAQQTLRHKSKKGSFRFVLWFIVILNCVGFAWLHTSDGHVFLEQVPHIQL
jgi:uncharacterized membrane protein YsdA (DUF1294 family)/cold shock CspA family protein